MATLGAHDKGDLIKCTGTWTDANGVAVDPTIVIFKFKNPAGTITSYTYGEDSEVVRDGAGIYHVEVNANASGMWIYRFESSGTGQAAEEERFIISESDFD